MESPDRFARDLAGQDYLRSLGVELVHASAPDFFLEDTPTEVQVRQVPGAISAKALRALRCAVPANANAPLA
jgi:hypothetical protein